jgi:ribosomal protein S18 acetylase RimI-like enzyme
LKTWHTTAKFIAGLMWFLMRDHLCHVNMQRGKPALDAIDFLSNYLSTEEITGLASSLPTVNFFQVTDQPSNLDYNIAFNSSVETWTEIERMMESFYPMAMKQLSQYWEKLKVDKRTKVILARSTQLPVTEEGVVSGPPTILGFLVGGIHPSTSVPCIFSVVILPDERRRGIGTTLVRRFFAQTGFSEAVANVVFKENEQPIEVGQFLKKQGGTMHGAPGKKFWRWRVPNPYSDGPQPPKEGGDS